MARIAAVTIVYNPGAEVRDNILTYSAYVEKLYVIDNSENPVSGMVQELQKIPNCQYISKGINEGIAVQLNLAAKMAMDEGYDLLLTMDQDSSFLPGELAQYFNCVKNLTENSVVAMIGVNFNQRNQVTSNCEYIESVDLITSGSLVNLQIWKKIGGFDENLFIDEVDLEYCYKAVQTGFKTLQFTGVHLVHNIGNTQKVRSLKNLNNSNRSLHSPLRIYYMVRNYFYVNQKYPSGFEENKQKRRKALLNRIKNNMLYGNSRFKVLSMVIRGYFDYLAGKKGKL